VYPQIFLFVITFFPAFLAVYAGSAVVADAINNLQTNAPWVLRGFEIAGGLLPAIGLALNMRFIFRGTVWPYFFIGYILAASSGGGLNIVTIGVVGVALAFLHVAFVGDRAERTIQQRGA
jgi:mannose/fructose/N-acetylgalactosamine-specific phosphotransferase system component IIC